MLDMLSRGFARFGSVLDPMLDAPTAATGICVCQRFVKFPLRIVVLVRYKKHRASESDRPEWGGFFWPLVWYLSRMAVVIVMRVECLQLSSPCLVALYELP